MKQELINRLNSFQTELQKNRIDLAIIIQNADLYYFTGTIQADYLCVPQEGDAILLARDGINRATTESPLDKIIEFKSSRDLLDIVKGEGVKQPTNLGLELDILPYKQVSKIQKVFKTTKVEGITHLIRKVRMIKSNYEIRQIRQASKNLGVIPQAIKENLTLGITELELSTAIESKLREQGHAGIIRMRGLNNEITPGICVSGANAQVPLKTDSLCGGPGISPGFGIGASNKEIIPGEPIVFDFMANHYGYHADQTRMAILGKPHNQIREFYEKMVEFQTKLSQYLRPGYTWEQVYHYGLEIAQELKVSENYLGIPGNKVKFVGHGVGLELNEYPFLAPGLEFNLQSGMIVALEPKLVVPELGGIGIENTYLVTEGKPEKLTTCSEELIIV